MSESVTGFAQFVNSYCCHRQKHVNWFKCPLANIQQQTMTQPLDFTLRPT